jgi:hypothetical protein
MDILLETESQDQGAGHALQGSRLDGEATDDHRKSGKPPLKVENQAEMQQ